MGEFGFAISRTRQRRECLQLKSYYSKILVLFCLILVNCKSTKSSVPNNEKEGAICDEWHACYYSGELKIWESHPPMGALKMNGGECINVSLPREVIRDLQRNGARMVAVSAFKIKTPPRVLSSGNIVVSVNVRGREITPEQCSNFYLFVN